ncbi:MAG: hypothetical protein WCW14_04265, partial [Candidatus Paceibacterota bacterium]
TPTHPNQGHSLPKSGVTKESEKTSHNQIVGAGSVQEKTTSSHIITETRSVTTSSIPQPQDGSPVAQSTPPKSQKEIPEDLLRKVLKDEE